MANKVEIIVEGVDKVSNVFAGITKSISGIGLALAGVVTAGAVAFVGLGKVALDATAEWEKLTLSMESLVAREMKTADATLSMADALAQAGPRAQELLGWMQKLAIESPFDIQGVAVTLQTALAYGFTSKEAQRLTQNLIDYAAASGRGVDVMNRVSLALGQIRAKGRLAGQEILQLTEAGIPVNDILKKMGFTLDDVSKGLVKSDEFLQAFNDTIETDFAGAAKRMTNSWGGLLSSLGDIKKIGLREFFQDTFDILQPLVVEFATWLQGDGLVKLKAWGKEMGKFTQRLVDMFKSLKGKSLTDIFDWKTIGEKILIGIDSIDWAAAGVKLHDGAVSAFKYIEDAAREMQLREIVGQAWIGASEALASAVTGQQVTLEASLAGYVAFGEGVKNAIAQWTANTEQGLFDWSMRTILAFQTWQANVTNAIWNAISGIVPFIRSAIYLWQAPVSEALRSVAIRFYNGAAAWVQQAINAILSLAPQLLSVISGVMASLKSILKPISVNISFSLPNFEALAAAAAAGVAMVNAALAGGSGKKGGKSKGGGSSGGSGGSGGNQTPMANGGSVRAGGSYWVGENGPEPFIPSQNGTIIPNNKIGGQNIVVNLTYAPAFSMADADEFQRQLLPFIRRGLRQVTNS